MKTTKRSKRHEVHTDSLRFISPYEAKQIRMDGSVRSEASDTKLARMGPYGWIKILPVLFIILFIGSQQTLLAQSPIDTLWTKIIDNNSGTEIARDVCQADDGGFVTVGAKGLKTMVVKTGSDGNTEWIKNYVVGTIGALPWAMQKTSDGGYIITGQMMTSGVPGDYYDCFLLRLNADGDSLWSKTYNITMDDDGRAVLETSDEGFIIAGYSIPCGGGDIITFVIRTDSNGNEIWTNTYGDPDKIWAYAMVHADNGYIVTGKIIPDGNYFSDIYIMKIDDSGEVIWTNSFGHQYNDRAASIKATSDGNFIIGGESRLEDTNTGDTYLAKINADGDTIWTKIYGGVHDDETCSSVVQTTDGGYMGVGYRRIDPSSLTRVWLLRFNDIGDTIWTEYYGPAYWSLGNSIKKTNDDGYIIAGVASDGTSTGDWDFYLIRLATEPTGIPEEIKTDKIILSRNFPNPFGYSTKINFYIPSYGKVKLIISDLTGKKIKTLINKNLQTGEYSIEFNASRLNNGIYFYTIETPKQSLTKRMILLK